ncbi:MAG: UvrD-helicase domain-containing protein [Alphaproteobacteria bacterium]|nr:UvrD-helicase domain-containing protein [Alphaproteobacteria bacterium]MBU1559876.1 UvrD-helicase domain-containing protein [Alphaproteobacteria bacterium]MBU2302178.1 UvrD-helicase domain-containing protein [Alphaproteobacteria bacterium]MBU2369522.1 UvrD-helicase domain-containing protein [Alphaproteobacteria bacterium]
MSGANHPIERPSPGAITSQFSRQAAPDYLQGLNEEQREAVLTIDGPLLVLAGAGTGKTRVLTTRIAHILTTKRAWPSEILSVTFTNKAAREMKERIGKLVGAGVEGMPWLGTFHSIGARILRRHAELVDLRSDFTILDTDDQIRLIKQLLDAENIDEKRWPAKQFAGMMDAWKNRGLLPKDVSPADSGAYANGRGAKLYADYQARLKVINAADFGDLLLECIRLFREYPDVLADYHRRFKYMLVDEYQDSNTAQYLWLRLLAQGKPASEANICVVGDDDQSIYGWRGAEVDNILRFEKDFPGAKVIKLERNYRSTGNILRAASAVIAFNEDRLGKTLHNDSVEKGEPLSVTSVWDSEEEARTIGDEIETYQRQGEALNSMAILVRASHQMRSFEERFITLGLNYRVIGGPRFYERKEIRDAIAYLRVVSNPSDGLSFERIVNTPKRGLGDTTVQLLHNAARAANVALLPATRMLLQTEELKAKPRSTLRDLINQFDDWSSRLHERVAIETVEGDNGEVVEVEKVLPPVPHYQLAEQILDESGYTKMWQDDKSPDAPGRLENLKELVRSMEEFETLGGFLEHISLVMDRDTAEADDAVSIMTLHSAKGLEFDTVFLPGWEEGLFPSQRTMDESGRAGLEEERRLAYVGITRARKRARLSVAQNRRINGLWQSAIPSRFLDELPADAVEVVDTGSSYGGYGYGGGASSRFNKADPFESVYETPGWQRARNQQASRKGGGPLTIDGDLVARSVDLGGDKSAFGLGERVFHLKFGYGAIADIEGNKLTIDFEKAGRKKVLESFVKKG